MEPIDGVTQRRTVAWHNPTWVLTLMCYPNEAALLAHTVADNETLLTDRTAWLERSAEATRRASTAGDVLALLYAMAVSPWNLVEEPSIGKAVNLVAQMHIQNGDWRTVPAGKTEIHQRVAEYRSVWHLWAAWRLIRDAVGQPKAEFADELADLLGTARAVQDWALVWRPQRGNTAATLVDCTQAYLVPQDVAPRIPQWGERSFPWLIETLKTYKPRER